MELLISRSGNTGPLDIELLIFHILKSKLLILRSGSTGPLDIELLIIHILKSKLLIFWSGSTGPLDCELLIIRSFNWSHKLASVAYISSVLYSIHSMMYSDAKPLV